jgi:hypothetical protein
LKLTVRLRSMWMGQTSWDKSLVETEVLVMAWLGERGFMIPEALGYYGPHW